MEVCDILYGLFEIMYVRPFDIFIFDLFFKYLFIYIVVFYVTSVQPYVSNTFFIIKSKKNKIHDIM